MSDAESVSSELGHSRINTIIIEAFCFVVSEATVSIVMMTTFTEMISFFPKHFYFKK